MLGRLQFGWLGYPLLVWLLWRLAYGLAIVVADGDIIDATLSWDANWYMNVLRNGYVLEDPTFTRQQNLNFFPGIVWLTIPFTWIASHRTAAVIVANLTSVAAFVTLFGTMRAVFNERIAKRSVIGLALWPGSIFLTAYYSEALFMVATAGAVWAAHRRNSPLACLLAFVAGLTRSIGFVLGPILAIHRVIQHRRVDRTAVAYGVAGPLGLALVCLVQGIQAGEPLGWVHSQAAWGRGLAPPWVAVRKALGGVVGSLPEFPLSHNLDLLAMASVTLALAAATWRLRNPTPTWGLLGWGWAAWVMPLFTTLPSSTARFALAAWPALAVLGSPDTVLTRRLRLVAASAGVILSVMVAVSWSRGGWIG